MRPPWPARSVVALVGLLRRYRGGMNDPTGHKGPVDLVFDVAVYAPVGLAYALADLVPELARRGRDRLGPQLSLARSVGQFAVNRGTRQARAVVEGMGGPAGSVLRSVPRLPWPFSGPGGAASAAPTGTVDASPPPAGPARPDSRRAAGAPTTQRTNLGDDTTRGGPAGAAAHPPADAGHPAPAVTDLAIPSYDSLSAPQVVQRLAGLSHDEVQAVRAYEAATRARRTIIARADQLLA